MWTRSVDREWLDSVCHELTRVTGWPVSFAPTPSLADSVSPESIRVDTFSWRNEIRDGDRILGTLGVVVPPGSELDVSFLRACDFADVIAQLLNRVFVEQSTAAELRTAAPTSHPPAISADVPEADPWTLAVNRVLDLTFRLTDLRAAALLVADPENDGFRMQVVRTRAQQSDLSFHRSLSEIPLDFPSLCLSPVVIRRQDSQLCEWLPEEMSLGVCYSIKTDMAGLSQPGQALSSPLRRDNGNAQPAWNDSCKSLGGLLWVFDRRDRRLTSREHQALTSIATRLSGLIERAVLTEESTLQRKLRSELRIASESQAEQSHSSDNLGGWCSVAGRLETYREVGGDLCEVIPLDDDRLLLAVGDAAGHSVPAAMIMATVRGALRVIAQDPQADEALPEKIVSRLNRVLYGVVQSNQFMTLTCAVINRRQNSIRIANAGHPPWLLIRNGEVHPLEQSGLLLGVVADAVYDSRIVTLDTNDLLVLYTDGVTEARSQDQQLFHATGISDVVRRHADESPDEIVTHVWDALQSHIISDGHDDRTLLVVRIGGTNSESPEAWQPGTTSAFASTSEASRQDAARVKTDGDPHNLVENSMNVVHPELS